jgi:hypothetical protein
MNKKIYSIASLVLAIAFPFTANASSIFLCRVYSGGSIWSSARCDPLKAIVEREIMIPDGMAWDQQVKYAEQRMAASRALQQVSPTTYPVTTTTVNTSSFGSGAGSQCKALATEITNYDSMARQPQSGQMQDWITEKKRAARTKQFELHCQ